MCTTKCICQESKKDKFTENSDPNNFIETIFEILTLHSASIVIQNRNFDEIFLPHIFDVVLRQHTDIIIN